MYVAGLRIYIYTSFISFGFRIFDIDVDMLRDGCFLCVFFLWKGEGIEELGVYGL